MKSKKSSRMECYDTTVLLKKIYSYYQKKRCDRCEQAITADKKGKTTKNARRWKENEF